MAKRRFARLARLRDQLHRQSLVALGYTQRSVQHCGQVLDEIGARIVNCERPSVTAADLQLLEGLALRTRQSLAKHEADRGARAREERRRATERDQMQRLANNGEEVRRQTMAKREDGEVEDWVVSRWGAGR